jgi:hypothetical protein
MEIEDDLEYGGQPLFLKNKNNLNIFENER